MTMRRAVQTDQSEAMDTTSKRIEQKVIAFAKQLGTLIGTVQAKGEGWLDRQNLSDEVGRIRDVATDLLDQMNQEGALQRKTTPKQTAIPRTRLERGPVDATGKHHRKPLPPEPLDKMMGEPIGKQMGQKSVKTGRRGRG